MEFIVPLYCPRMNVVRPISRLTARPLLPTTTALHPSNRKADKQSHLLMSSSYRRHQVSQTRFIHPPRKQPLTPEESQIARRLFKTLIDYAPERTPRGCYKPVALIDETFERIQCKDVFLKYFFTYIYTNIIPEEERRTGSVFPQVFAYFRDFSSWSSKSKDTAVNTVDNFAEYLIDTFFMPRELMPPAGLIFPGMS